jgi:hypothetical protein
MRFHAATKPIFMAMIFLFWCGSPQQTARADQPANDAALITRSYDVHDLIVSQYTVSLPVPDLMKEDRGSELMTDSTVNTPEQSQLDLIDHIEKTIEFSSWKSVPPIQANRGVLVIRQTADVHEKIATLIEQIRKGSSSPRIKIDAEFFEVNSNAEIDNPLRDEFKIGAAHTTGRELLTSDAMNTLEDLALQRANIKTSATSIDLRNGKGGYSLIGGGFRYVKSFDAIGAGDQLRFQPHEATCIIGKLFDVERALLSADHRYVTVDLRIQWNRLDWIDTVTFDAERHLETQQPVISCAESRIRITIPVSGGALFAIPPLKLSGGTNRAKQTVEPAPEIYLLIKAAIPPGRSVAQTGELPISKKAT